MKPHIWRGDAGKVPRIGKKWKDLCNRARDAGGVFQKMFEIGHSDDFLRREPLGGRRITSKNDL